MTSTVCVGPAIGTPLTPARNAAVWVPGVPIRMVRASAATPVLAMSMLFEPVVRLRPAPLPTATFEEPVVLASSALVPSAVFDAPVSWYSALTPSATLLLAAVFDRSAWYPLATLLLPVALE